MARQQLMTQRAYAALKHVQVSPQYINKLVSQGKIRKIGSKIDRYQADAAIAAFRRAGRVVQTASKRKAAAPARRPSTPRSSARPAPVAGGSRIESATATLTRSRATTEEFKAKTAELEYRRLIKELLPAAEVLEAERRKNANIRATFRRLARTMAPVLHRAATPAELELALLAEVDLALEELAGDPLGSREPAPEIPAAPAIAEPPAVDLVESFALPAAPEVLP